MRWQSRVPDLFERPVKFDRSAVIPLEPSDDWISGSFGKVHDDTSSLPGFGVSKADVANAAMPAFTKVSTLHRKAPATLV